MNTIDGSDPVIINHSINLNHSNTKKQQSNSNNNSSRELTSSESNLNKMKYKKIQNSFDIRNKELNDKHLKDLQLSRNFIRDVSKHKEYYIERYYKNQQRAHCEKMKHLHNNVFSQDNIDFIVKCKNDVEIDRMKFDYKDHERYFNEQYNTIANKYEGLGDVKMGFLKLMDEHKHTAENVKSRYKIRDFIK